MNNQSPVYCDPCSAMEKAVHDYKHSGERMKTDKPDGIRMYRHGDKFRCLICGAEKNVDSQPETVTQKRKPNETIRP